MYSQLASDPTASALVVIAWVATGIVVGLVAMRSGHHARAWLGLGVALGPFAVPLLLVKHRWAAHTPPIVLDEGDEAPGARVLVVSCGEPSDVADLVSSLRGRSRPIGLLALARPVDVDSATEPQWGAVKEAAASALHDAAELVEPPRPRLLLLPGGNARDVARYVITNRIDEVAVLGSTRLLHAAERHPDLRERLTADDVRARSAPSRR